MRRRPAASRTSPASPKSHFGLEYLRDPCPCATCSEGPRAKTAVNPLKLFTPKLRILGVEPVGNYALKIDWSDGHSTGIYSFPHLRSISQVVPSALQPTNMTLSPTESEVVGCTDHARRASKSL